MKKHVIGLILLGCVISASAQKLKSVPVIDYQQALTDKRPMKLSEIVEEVEYVELKFPESLVDSNIGVGPRNLIVGNQVIVFRLANLERIFIFDRKGNFIHAFDETSPVSDLEPIRPYPLVSMDLSPDEKHLLLARGSGINLYDINGDFLRNFTMPWKRSQFFFLDNEQIAVLRSRTDMKEDGNLIFISTPNIELTDSIFRVKTAGLSPFQTGRPARLPSDLFLQTQDKIYLQLADQDTLYEILPDHRLKPIFSLNLGKLKPSYKWFTNYSAMMDSSIQVNSMVETRDFYILDLSGPMRKDGADYEYQTLILNKGTGQSFVTDRLTNNPDSSAYYHGFIDDLDGLGSTYYQYSNGVEITSVNPERWKKQIESDTSKASPLRNSRYVDKLKTVIATSSPKSPIIRIVHFDKPGEKTKKIRFRPKYPAYSDLKPIAPVRTNHQWKGAETLSDITYDPSDDSFWLVKMKFGKADSIEHRSRTGEILPGGFVTEKDVEVEAITCSSHDNTLWMSNCYRNGFAVIHFDKNGHDLGDGFQTKDLTGIFGMAYDPTDRTLWLMESNKHMLWHYSLTGERLGSGFDVHLVRSDEPRGLLYDPRDNSLWILNASPHKLIHVSKTGEILPGTFYYDPFLGLPDGAALDFKGFEFWVGDWGRRNM